MTPKLLMTSALLACAILAGAGADATARGWGYGGGFRGGYGGGFGGGYGGAFGHAYAHSFYAPGWSHSANVSRMPGQVSGTRSFQTPGGRGAPQTFSRGCSGGTCQRSRTTTTNSGKTFSRSASISKSGTGTVSRTRSVTGP